MRLYREVEDVACTGWSYKGLWHLRCWGTIHLIYV